MPSIVTDMTQQQREALDALEQLEYASDYAMLRDRNTVLTYILNSTPTCGAHPLDAATSRTDKWQPIETAPKDGTKILISDDRGQRFIAWWDNNATYERFKIGPGWQVFNPEDEWYSIALTQDEVTHWMPLPEPPEET